MRRLASVAALLITVPGWTVAALLLHSWYTDTHDTCGPTPLWNGPLIFFVPVLGLVALVTALLGETRDGRRTALGNAAYLSASLAVLWSIWFFMHTFTITLCSL